MDMQHEELLVLDPGKQPEEIASEMACCSGRPSAPSGGDPVQA